MEDQALSEVVKWLSQHTGTQVENIGPDDLLEHHLGDSLDLVSFVMHFEDLGLELPEVPEQLRTVRDLADWIRRGREF